MSGINFERLDAAITYAHDRPDEFDMDMWYQRGPDCGTTACIAGIAVALEGGWEPIWVVTGDDDVEEDGGEEDAYDVHRDGQQIGVGHLAASLLGLDFNRRSLMFHVEDLNAVIEIRNQWARETGIPERAWGEQK